MNQPKTVINVKPANGPVPYHTAEITDACKAMEVEILQAPTFEQLESYIPEFVMATWEDKPGDCTPNDPATREWITNEVLHQRSFIPTAAETINITFKITNLSVQDVTHLIRYRRGSFSAQCTGDRYMTEEKFVIPSIIAEKPELAEKFRNCIQTCQDTYTDLVNAGISPLDARYVMPMARSTFYYVKFAYPDVISFIRGRIDRNIQPMSDNVMAYKMFEALLKQYPCVYDMVNLDAPPKFYHQAMNTYYCSNLYQPEEIHKVDFDPNNFVYEQREWTKEFVDAYNSALSAQLFAEKLWDSVKVSKETK